MKKIFMFLFMLFVVSGCSCSNEQCECPEVPSNSELVYENIVSDYSELYKKTTTSVVKIRSSLDATEITGSGVVFYENGDYAYVLTNAHVMESVNAYYDGVDNESLLHRLVLTNIKKCTTLSLLKW